MGVSLDYIHKFTLDLSYQTRPHTRSGSVAHIDTVVGIQANECLLASRNLDVAQTAAKVASPLFHLQK